MYKNIIFTKKLQGSYKKKGEGGGVFSILATNCHDDCRAYEKE